MAYFQTPRMKSFLNGVNTTCCWVIYAMHNPFDYAWATINIVMNTISFCSFKVKNLVYRTMILNQKQILSRCCMLSMESILY